jgi:hypothetical protein
MLMVWQCHVQDFIVMKGCAGLADRNSAAFILIACEVVRNSLAEAAYFSRPLLLSAKTTCHTIAVELRYNHAVPS